MGNRSSLSLRRRAKNPKASPATAAIPADLTAEQPRLSSPPIASARPELLTEKTNKTPREDASEADLATNQQSEGSEDDDEDPLQFFRRLSNNSEGDGRGSQDLFMSYTQALLLKQGGDYAAASTLLRLVRHYKSLETEAHFHLAQCLLQLDPELRCFVDEIAMCLEKVCSSNKSPASDECIEDADAWSQMQRESTELLAHVLVAQGHVERAKDLYSQLRQDSEARGGDNQYEEQLSVHSFQLAFCELALGDLDAAHEQLQSVDCRRTLPLTYVDAQAMRLVMERVRANEVLTTSSEASGGFAA